MDIVNRIATFGCGVLTTALAFTLYAELGAQGMKPAIDVCANGEGTLRLTEATVPCLAGERRLRLRQPDLAEDTGDDKKKKDEDGRVADMQDRLKQLEERAANGRLLGSRVFAPFEVVNEAGYAVFKVDDGSVVFSNSGGTTVSRVAMTGDGSYFEARSTTAKLSAVIGTSSDQANVFVVENDQRRINLGRNDKGAYGLRVYEPGGKIVAGIGQATSGDGVVTINDAQGNQRAAMYVEPKAGGVLDILNVGGKVVATFAASPAGNGQMFLYNKDGVAMVEAGVTKDNIGKVAAGPGMFHPGVGILGLPGSFIVGKAAQ
jgi:hypothetical protein